MKKILLVVLVIIVLGIGLYFFRKTSDVQNQIATSTVTIMVPSNLKDYQNAVIQYINTGGNNPVSNFQFIPKTVTPVIITTDPLRNVAEAAAEVIPGQGLSNQIAYFKIVNGTAYVLLNMDIDGWAGVSFYIAQIHPLVEKSLLTQPSITAVKFGLAPGDTLSTK